MGPLGHGQGIPGSLVLPLGCLQLRCLRVFSGLPVSELLLLSSPLEQQLAVFGMCRPECLRPCLVWERLSCAFCARLEVLSAVVPFPALGDEIVGRGDPPGQARDLTRGLQGRKQAGFLADGAGLLGRPFGLFPELGHGGQLVIHDAAEAGQRLEAGRGGSFRFLGRGAKLAAFPLRVAHVLGG